MKGREWLTLILLVAMSFFLMCDMFITPAILPELSQEYGVSHEVLGWVSSLFILLGAAVGVWVGHKADSANRKHLLIAVVLIGELPCFLTGLPWFSQDFIGFVILRTLTGIGIGGLYPLTFSLLSDYFSDKHRGKACAAVDLAWGIGTVIGPILATLALQSDYGWRLAFLLAASPNFPMVLLFALIAREPVRGKSEGTLGSETDLLMPKNARIAIQQAWQNRTNRLMFCQGIPGSIPWGVLPFWLILVFTQSHQLSREQSVMIWEIFGIAAGLGGFTWAVVGDRLIRWRVDLLPVMCAVGVLTGMLPCLLLFNGAVSSFTACAALALISGLLVSVPASNCKAILMNVNSPAQRGSVFAIYNLCDNLGKGLGPALGGVLISLTQSYGLMVNFAIGLWLICAACFIAMAFTIGADRNQMLASLNTTTASAK